MLQGKYMDMFADSQAARQSLTKAMKREKVKGFAEVLVSESMVDGLAHTIQTAGVGGLRHNTVIVGWPQNWRKKANEEKPFKAFIGEKSSIRNHHCRDNLKLSRNSLVGGCHLQTFEGLCCSEISPLSRV